MYHSRVPKGQRAKERVGKVVTNELGRRIIKFKPVLSRIMKITVDLKVDLGVILTYATIESTNKRKTTNFYQVLQKILDSIKETM